MRHISWLQRAAQGDYPNRRVWWISDPLQFLV